ncbi:ubiquitin-like with PHD and RING finger domains 2 [Apophysomyces ossiformis]|uniref:Ubiquitin-like with PHD and RING finger domains 2 n=1 Tax=Apophysomyces ossiformis TaxID=679940 RepID=A0A8H7BLQ3_9FUNG|nr:ubiquitin-like with PHD and RING finger domains 2 [Apophysomyces ossiformis]
MQHINATTTRTISSYEEERARRIAENQSLLASLGLVGDILMITEKPYKQVKARPLTTSNKVHQQEKPRRSPRFGAEKRVYYYAMEDENKDSVMADPKMKRRKYTSEGDSCHQCRQKTTKLKIRCTALKPDGTQCTTRFDRACLSKYGETIDEAMQYGNWVCFSCRGNCLCSICRKKKGLQPSAPQHYANFEPCYTYASQYGIATVEERKIKEKPDQEPISQKRPERKVEVVIQVNSKLMDLLTDKIKNMEWQKNWIPMRITFKNNRLGSFTAKVHREDTLIESLRSYAAMRLDTDEKQTKLWYKQEEVTDPKQTAEIHNSQQLCDGKLLRADYDFDEQTPILVLVRTDVKRKQRPAPYSVPKPAKTLSTPDDEGDDMTMLKQAVVGRSWHQYTDRIILISPSRRYQRTFRVDPDIVAIEEKFQQGVTITAKNRSGHLPHVGFQALEDLGLNHVLLPKPFHRPLIAGIHGSQNLGTVLSIVMSGKYPEDEDYGEEFIYTGSGGRKGTNDVQTFDQELTRSNLTLAKCCSAPLNVHRGADAGENWKRGDPIRVVRGANLRNMSAKRSSKPSKETFAPSEGYRYDGIYKVTRYWSGKGVTGHKVWRFALRRDDSTPTPWSANDSRFIRDHCPRMLTTERNEERHRTLLSFHGILRYLGPNPDYRKKVSVAYHAEERSKDIKDVEEALTMDDIDSSAYRPPIRLLRALLEDQANKRIWKRVLDKTFQEVNGVYDYLTFVETALTQLELQCLLCNASNQHKAGPRYRDDLNIPLVRGESLHCARCDYNFCNSCLRGQFEMISMYLTADK